MYDRLVSETADPWFGGRIDAFFSALEIPFPGNGDRSRQRLGSNGQLLRRKPEHLVLAGPDIAPKPKPDRLASVFGMALAMAVINHPSDHGVGEPRLGCADPANGNDLRASTGDFVLKGRHGRKKGRRGGSHRMRVVRKKDDRGKRPGGLGGGVMAPTCNRPLW